MEFNWSIQKLIVAEDKLVVKVGLMVTGTDGDNSASAAYTRNLVRGNTFTPFNQLTEQQVLDWCFAPETLTWTDITDPTNTISKIKLLKEEGEAQVTDQIQRQLAQKESEPALPWV